MPLPYEKTSLGLEIPAYYGGEEDARVMARNLKRIDDLLSAGGGAPSLPGAVTTHVRMALQTAVANGIRASYFGLGPNATSSVSGKLREALQWCRTNNRVLLLPPGDYPHDEVITGAGGGMVCVGGRARIVSVYPFMNGGEERRQICFGADGPGYTYDVVVAGIDFYNSTRPDSGFGIGIGGHENGSFMQLRWVDRFVLADCTFSHNNMGGILYSDSKNGVVMNVRMEDVLKDNHHCRRSTENVLFLNNVCEGSMDDSFAVVGYVGEVRPRRIVHMNCHAKGSRARGFAYVGAEDIANINCSYDGEYPAYLPQQVSDPASPDSPNGGAYKYRGSCGLYVASEGSHNTQGVERLIVRGMRIANTAQMYHHTTGARASTLRAIHVYAGNQVDTGRCRDIDIEATVVDTQNSFALLDAGKDGWLSDVKLTLNGRDCTDPRGWDLTESPGVGKSVGVEIYRARNVTLRGRISETGTGAVFADANCTGYLDIDVEIGHVNKSATNSVDAIGVASGCQAELSLAVRCTTPPPFTGATTAPYAVDRLVELTGGMSGRVRKLELVGNVGSASLVTQVRSTRLASSPTNGYTWQNNTGQKVTLRASPSSSLDNVGILSVNRASGGGRYTVVPPFRDAISATTSTTITLSGDQTARYASGTLVYFYSPMGDLLGTAVVSAAPTFSSPNTTVTFAAVPGGVTTTSRSVPEPAATTLTVTGDRTAQFPASTTVQFYTDLGEYLGSGTTVASAATYSAATGLTTITLTAAPPTTVVPGVVVSPVPATWVSITSTTASNITSTTGGTQITIAGNRTANYGAGTTVYFYDHSGASLGSAAVSAAPAFSSWFTTVTFAALPAGVTAGCVCNPGAAATFKQILDARRMTFDVLPGEWIQFNWQTGAGPAGIDCFFV